MKPLRQLQALFTQGASPRQISLAIALSVPLGIIPLFGLITPLATALAVRLRLNVPLVLGLVYLALPLQLLLFVPFLRMGESLFQLAPLPFSPHEIMAMIETTGWGIFQQIWVNNLAALAVWLLLAFPLGGLFFYLGQWACLRWQRAPSPSLN
ncbi:MAG: DUF2062 domain-containing protein [Cyclobacteriaceae bacterium]